MSEYVVARPIGTLSNVSQTRSSKSVPIRTTRNGASGRQRTGSKARLA
jgi:hypothetical protein